MQKLRYNDKELELISNTFSDNLEIIMTIRKHLLQGYLLEAEKIELKKLNEDVIKILRKTLLPVLDTNMPLHQNIDMWSNINTKEKLPEESNLEMIARNIVIEYLEQQFESMNGEEKEESVKTNLKDLIFTPGRDPVEAHIKMSARNTIVQHIDYQLAQIQVIAGQKRESAEDIKKRLLKDSTK